MKNLFLFLLVSISISAVAADQSAKEGGREPASVRTQNYCQSQYSNQDSNEYWNCKYGDMGDLGKTPATK